GSSGPSGTFNRHKFTGATDAPLGTLPVTNNFGLVGGRDAESDDDYRSRLSRKVQSSAAANEAALRLELLEIPGIQDVVFERQAGAFIVLRLRHLAQRLPRPLAERPGQPQLQSCLPSDRPGRGS